MASTLYWGYIIGKCAWPMTHQISTKASANRWSATDQFCCFRRRPFSQHVYFTYISARLKEKTAHLSEHFSLHLKITGMFL